MFIYRIVFQYENQGEHPAGLRDIPDCREKTDKTSDVLIFG